MNIACLNFWSSVSVNVSEPSQEEEEEVSPVCPFSCLFASEREQHAICLISEIFLPSTFVANMEVI